MLNIDFEDELCGHHTQCDDYSYFYSFKDCLAGGRVLRVCYRAGEYRRCRGAVLGCGGVGPARSGQHSAGRVLRDWNHWHLPR